jgi:uncharacterized membrane protein HdeD (DUF308 family)
LHSSGDAACSLNVVIRQRRSTATAAALLTLILGASLLASGIMRIILAFSMKQETPWIWILLSGAITLRLGLLILAHWPVSSLYILGLFLRIDLVMAGAGWIGLGFGLHRGRPAAACSRCCVDRTKGRDEALSLHPDRGVAD